MEIMQHSTEHTTSKHATSTFLKLAGLLTVVTFSGCSGGNKSTKSGVVTNVNYTILSGKVFAVGFQLEYTQITEGAQSQTKASIRAPIVVAVVGDFETLEEAGWVTDACDGEWTGLNKHLDDSKVWFIGRHPDGKTTARAASEVMPYPRQYALDFSGKIDPSDCGGTLFKMWLGESQQALELLVKDSMPSSIP